MMVPLILRSRDFSDSHPLRPFQLGPEASIIRTSLDIHYSITRALGQGIKETSLNRFTLLALPFNIHLDLRYKVAPSF